MPSPEPRPRKKDGRDELAQPARRNAKSSPTKPAGDRRTRRARRELEAPRQVEGVPAGQGRRGDHPEPIGPPNVKVSAKTEAVTAGSAGTTKPDACIQAPAFVRKPAGGRPSKLTDDLTERICSALRAGIYLETAAAMNGLHKDTLYSWLKRGARYLATQNGDPGASPDLDPADESFGRFSDALHVALAHGDAFDETAISQAVRAGAWRAAAWRQERKHPDRWGRRDRVDVGGVAGAPIVVEMWSPAKSEDE